MRISYAAPCRLHKTWVLVGLVLASAPRVSGGGHGSATVTDLLDAAQPAMDQTVEVSGYYASGGPGGGEFRWDAKCPKSTHNGGTVMSPTVPWDGRPGASHIGFLDGDGESDPAGHGCWKRPASDEVRFTEWGGRGDWDGSVGTDNQQIWLRVRAHGIGTQVRKVILDPGYANDYWFGDTVVMSVDNLELIIPPAVTARSTKPTSQGTLFLLGRPWLRRPVEPAAVKNVGVSGGGTIIVQSPGDNENAIGLSKVHGGWVRGMNLPDTNRKAVTLQYDFQDVRVEDNRIGRTGHDAITVQGLFDASVARPEAPHKDVFILHNVIQNAGRHGFLAQRNFAVSMSRIVVRGNTIVSAAERGISFNGVDGPVHEGNVVYAANVGAWFKHCTQVRGDVDVHNSRAFGLYMSNVRDYDFAGVFIDSAANDAIHEVERSGHGRIGRLRVTGGTHSYVYSSRSPDRSATPLVIEQYNGASEIGGSRRVKTNKRQLQPHFGREVPEVILERGTSTPPLGSSKDGVGLYALDNDTAQPIADFSTSSSDSDASIVVRGDGHSVLKHSAASGLRLRGSVDATPTSAQYIALRREGGLWREISRNY